MVDSCFFLLGMLLPQLRYRLRTAAVPLRGFLDLTVLQDAHFAAREEVLHHPSFRPSVKSDSLYQMESMFLSRDPHIYGGRNEAGLACLTVDGRGQLFSLYPMGSVAGSGHSHIARAYISKEVSELRTCCARCTSTHQGTLFFSSKNRATLGLIGWQAGVECWGQTQKRE